MLAARIVGAGQISVPLGASWTSVPASQQRQKRVAGGEAVRFARAVLDRPYKFTIILLVANFFRLSLDVAVGGMTVSTPSGNSRAGLKTFGAKLNFLIKNDHQWWVL